MAQPYVGEIRIFAGNFAPAGWMLCEGQLLPISEYETLFNLIGTTYGGDGQSTYALPDLRGRLALHQGNGYTLSETVGQEQVTLTTQQIPSHTHPLLASVAGGTTADPEGKVVASPPSVTMFLRESPTTDLPAAMVGGVGGSQPHENRMPVVAIHHIISLFGIFPSPS
jgi:microcystin-dependent protein